MKITLLLSLLLNAFLLIRGVDFIKGFGKDAQSPDKIHTVSVMSKRNANPFAKDRQVYAEVSLYSGYISGEVLKTVVVSPLHEPSEMSYYHMKNTIKWSEDYQEVTVTTPDFTLSLNMRPIPPAN